jgi:hypothetical protein
VTLPAPLVRADGIEATTAAVDTRVTEDVIAPVHVPAPVPETVTGIATGAPTAAPTGLAPMLMVVAAGAGAGAVAVGEKTPITVLLGVLFGDTANAWIVTEEAPATGAPAVPIAIAVVYLFELVVGTVPSVV